MRITWYSLFSGIHLPFPSRLWMNSVTLLVFGFGSQIFQTGRLFRWRPWEGFRISYSDLWRVLHNRVVACNSKCTKYFFSCSQSGWEKWEVERCVAKIKMGRMRGHYSARRILHRVGRKEGRVEEFNSNSTLLRMVMRCVEIFRLLVKICNSMCGDVAKWDLDEN